MGTDPRTAHAVSILAQLQEKHPLIATQDRWLMAKPGDQPEPCLKEGQPLVLESIDVDNFCYYPPLSEADLDCITDLIDFESHQGYIPRLLRRKCDHKDLAVHTPSACGGVLDSGEFDEWLFEYRDTASMISIFGEHRRIHPDLHKVLKRNAVPDGKKQFMKCLSCGLVFDCIEQYNGRCCPNSECESEDIGAYSKTYIEITYSVKEIDGTEYLQIETLAKKCKGEIFGHTFDGSTVICLASFRGLLEELQFIEACRDAGFTARKMLTDYQENITYPIDEIP